MSHPKKSKFRCWYKKGLASGLAGKFFVVDMGGVTFMQRGNVFWIVFLFQQVLEKDGVYHCRISINP